MSVCQFWPAGCNRTASASKYLTLNDLTSTDESNDLSRQQYASLDNKAAIEYYQLLRFNHSWFPANNIIFANVY